MKNKTTEVQSKLTNVIQVDANRNQVFYAVNSMVLVSYEVILQQSHVHCCILNYGNREKGLNIMMLCEAILVTLTRILTSPMLLEPDILVILSTGEITNVTAATSTKRAFLTP